MDILAHGLWAGAGLVALSHARPVDKPTLAWAVALAVLPDVVHTLPVAAWALANGTPGAWLSYATAAPGGEPDFPAWVALWSHQLHCVFHSALVAAAATALLRAWLRRLWLPLLGWWSHIVIDVFTHSADFYPSPVFYPITYWGFDGIAWNTPGFMALNYAALLVVGVWLWRKRRA
jgi:hypothetical protein